MWYIDNGFLKHMTGDKDKFISFNEIYKENSVTFRNNTPATIKGKGTIILKEKLKLECFIFLWIET